MTAVLPEREAPTLVDGFADMVKDLASTLSANPYGASLCLMVRPPATPQDTVYVQRQRPDGVIELHPRRLSELQPADLIHDTQVVFDPADPAFARYATEPIQAGACGMIEDEIGRKHVYA